MSVAKKSIKTPEWAAEANNAPIDYLVKRTKMDQLSYNWLATKPSQDAWPNLIGIFAEVFAFRNKGNRLKRNTREMENEGHQGKKESKKRLPPHYHDRDPRWDQWRRDDDDDDTDRGYNYFRKS